MKEEAETGEKNYQLISFTEDGLSLGVRVDAEKETVWLTQSEMAELFSVDRTRIVRHLNNIFRSRELDRQATCAESAHVQIEGSRTVRRPRPIYNLEAIFSVGYLMPFENDLREWGVSLDATCTKTIQVQIEGKRNRLADSIRGG